jgi:hypothetical protein
VVNITLIVNSRSSSTTLRAICFSQLPYSWNGQSYNAAGNYNVTLVNGAGCDSIATLVLTVNSFTTSNTNIVICSNQLPYSWNGQSYSAAGSYNVTLVGSSGCDSIATLGLTVNTGSFNSENQTACGTYSWHGNTYTISGNYIYSYSNSSSCPSVDTLHLTINTATFTATTQVACGSYIWHGNTYTLSGTFVFNYVNGVGCASADTLHLTINTATHNSYNQTSCGSYLWNGTLYSASGTYTYSYTNGLGCLSADTLHLIINNGTFNSFSQNACQSFVWHGTTYSASGNYFYNYTNAAGCSSTDTLHLIVSNGVPVSLTQTACDRFVWNGTTYTSSGTYIYQYPIGSGCSIADTLRLTINQGTFTGSSQSACGSYTWHGVAYTSSGIYFYNYSNASGCPSVDSIILTINSIPAAPVVSSPVNYCQNDNASALSASGSNQILWYTSPSGGIGNTLAPIPLTTSIGTYYYYVSQTNGLCEGPRVSIIVKINPKPILDIDRDIKICYGSALDLSNLYNTSGLNSTWSFNQQIVSNPSGVDVPGVYQLIVSNTAGCLDTAFVNLSIQSEVIANAGPDDTTDFYTPYTLQGSSVGGYLYQWTPSGYPILNNPYILNPIAMLTTTTQFILMVEDKIGCRDYDSVIIYVKLGTDFYIPTAFTPNGDGLNDEFGPTPMGGIEELDFFRIYSRWGQLVFETRDITQHWDGTYKGKAQDTDNYVWELKGRNRLGEEKFLKGNVVLIR